MASLAVTPGCPEFFDERLLLMIVGQVTSMKREEIGLNCTLNQSLALNWFDLKLIS